MRVDILTLFPGMFSGPFQESIIRRAQEKRLLEICLHDIRDWSIDKHRSVDDTPYGGGPGMVMRVDVVHRALEAVIKKASPKKRGVRRILLTPQGRVFDQKVAAELAGQKRLVLICGRYEGIDHRIIDYVDDEISIGDYVLTGGELPAMIITDAVTRLIPGVVGTYESVENESFIGNLLDYPHYTRPREYDGKQVPPVLISGHQKKIDDWRRQQAEELTRTRRPDMLKS